MIEVIHLGTKSSHSVEASFGTVNGATSNSNKGIRNATNPKHFLFSFISGKQGDLKYHQIAIKFK